MSKPTERAEFRFQRATQILATSILQTPADSPMVAPNGAMIEIAYGLMEAMYGRAHPQRFPIPLAVRRSRPAPHLEMERNPKRRWLVSS